jgi:hypothetical protein
MYYLECSHVRCWIMKYKMFLIIFIHIYNHWNYTPFTKVVIHHHGWRYSPGWALASSTMCLQAS